MKLRLVFALGLAAAAALTAGSASGAAQPDLRVTMLIDPPSVLPAGAEFSTAAVVGNTGTGDSPGSRTRFYLSANSTLGASDRVLGTRPTRGLRPRSQSLRSLRIGLPEATSPGDYFLLVCADDRRQVRERSESNNCYASAYPMRVTSLAGP